MEEILDRKVPGTGLTDSQFLLLERELEEALSPIFRRVWLQATPLQSMCLTCFYNDISKGYTIFCVKNVKQFSKEIILGYIGFNSI